MDKTTIDESLTKIASSIREIKQLGAYSLSIQEMGEQIEDYANFNNIKFDNYIWPIWKNSLYTDNGILDLTSDQITDFTHNFAYDEHIGEVYSKILGCSYSLTDLNDNHIFIDANGNIELWHLTPVISLIQINDNKYGIVVLYSTPGSIPGDESVYLTGIIEIVNQSELKIQKNYGFEEEMILTLTIENTVMGGYQPDIEIFKLKL